MAEALARGFTSKGVARADNMWCYDPSEQRRQALKNFGVMPCSSSVEVLTNQETILQLSNCMHITRICLPDRLGALMAHL